MLQQIPLTSAPSWQESLSDLVTDPDELLHILQLEASQLPMAEQGLRDFPLRVPRPYLARIRPGNPRDPLLLQVLPQTAEDLDVAGFVADPLQEAASNPVPGILHKYAGRVLLMPTSSCAIHCRYCFRRHFPYQDNIPDRRQWQQSLDWLQQHGDIHEVILSGGDPLAISDRHLDWLLKRLEEIPHVQTLRIHTRLPIMIPARITTELCQQLAVSRLQVVVVLHCNHDQEIDTEVVQACQALKGSGATLLNQSVLLRGINDSASALVDLSQAVFAAGILPYYLHLLDRTRGTAHFEVSDIEANRLLQTLRAQLPGYLVPRLVREVPGELSKTPAEADIRTRRSDWPALTRARDPQALL